MMTNRELDKWIQEHIMGYSGLKTVYTWRDRKKKERPIEVFSSNPDRRELGDFSAYVDEEGTKIYCREPHGIFHIHHYTESISDAFQVVEKIRSEGYLVELKGYSDGWRVWINPPKAGILGHFNDLLPLAICVVAKRAIEGVE